MRGQAPVGLRLFSGKVRLPGKDQPEVRGGSVTRCGISNQAATSWVTSTPSTYRRSSSRRLCHASARLLRAPSAGLQCWPKGVSPPQQPPQRYIEVPPPVNSCRNSSPTS